MRRATNLIHTSEIKVLLNLLSVILVLIFVNAKALIMRATYMVLARNLRRAGTTLVTPVLAYRALRGGVPNKILLLA